MNPSRDQLSPPAWTILRLHHPSLGAPRSRVPGMALCSALSTPGRGRPGGGAAGAGRGQGEGESFPLSLPTALGAEEGRQGHQDKEGRERK